MTYSEMSYEFLVKYDAIAGLHAPGYNAKEQSVLLTAAQEILIKNRLVPQGNTYADTFEETEKRRSELTNLIKPFVTTTFYSNDNNLEGGVFLDLPSDYWLAIQERTDLKVIKASGCYDIDDIITDVWTKPITHDYYIGNISNPFKKPYEELVWRVSTGVEFFESQNDIPPSTTFELVIGKGLEVSKYKLRYIKKPTPIILSTDIIDGVQGPKSCELHPSLHREIIDKAVEMAVEISKDTTRYQTLKMQNKLIE